MSSLSAVYNNQLGDVYETFKQVNTKTEATKALAKLLVAYGLNDAYDIRLTHKHFDIADDEQVVGFGGEDMMLSAVCKNGQVPLELLREHNIQPLADGVIVPSDYLINDHGEAIPYEFVYGIGVDQGAERLSKGFLTEWSSILRRHNVAGLLGLSVQDDAVPVSAHEKSEPDSRLNMLYYGEPAEEDLPGLLTTTWRVGNVGGIIEAKQCSYCYDLRYHHKNCTAPSK